MPPTKKQISKGFYGFESDDAEFLKPDNPVAERGNWDASASGQGYNSKFADDTGYQRGALGFTDEGGDGALRNLMPDESRDSNLDQLRTLPDDDAGMGSGSKWLGGGGPIPQNRDVGSGTPRYGAKTGPRTNSRRS